MALVYYTVHARGFGADFEEANERARRRLRLAAAAIDEGNLPNDPGVMVRQDDPGGGGGGPCAPEYIKIEVNVTPSGLPEARGND